MMITRFEDLAIWKKARTLNQSIYELTRRREFARDFGLVDQLRRASVSIMNNIAEGFERYRRNEFLQFLSVSKGSAGEVRSMLYVALDIGYLDEKTFTVMLNQVQELSGFIGKFRASLSKSPPKPLTATSKRKN